jgi:hypothetical protein
MQITLGAGGVAHGVVIYFPGSRRSRQLNITAESFS